MSDELNIDVYESVIESTYVIAAIDLMLGIINCSEEVRTYVFTLIGMSNGQHEFRVADLVVARYMKPTQRSIKDDSLRKSVSRARKELEETQERHGVIFVECEHGYKTKNNRIYPSKYRLPIIGHLENVISAAKRDTSSWEKSPLEAIQEATYQLFKDLLNKPFTPPKRRTYKLEEAALLAQKLKTVKTNIERVKQRLERDNKSLPIEDKQIYEELLKSIEELSRQVEGEQEEEEEG